MHIGVLLVLNRETALCFREKRPVGMGKKQKNSSDLPTGRQVNQKSF